MRIYLAPVNRAGFCTPVNQCINLSTKGFLHLWRFLILLYSQKRPSFTLTWRRLTDNCFTEKEEKPPIRAIACPQKTAPRSGYIQINIFQTGLRILIIYQASFSNRW
jgi:hypothetical protein